jgi:hypothetical protein
MKRILSLAVIALMVFASPIFAAVTTATFGDYNSSNAYRLTADSDGVLTFASDTAVKYPYSTASTNQTLTATQSGSTIIFNNGSGVAQNGTTFLLPTAVVGMQFTIVADVAKWFFVDAQSTDTINFSTATAGQRISNSATAIAGDSITLFCATANKWSVVDHNGTWAVGPGQ